MRSAAGGNTAGVPLRGGGRGTSARGWRADAALPQGRMTWAPQPGLPRCPPALPRPGRVRQTHRQRVPNRDARGQEVGGRTGPPPPGGADNRKREVVGEKETGRGKKEEP